MKVYDGCRIYGPYLRSDGRKHVVVVWPDGRKQTVSYPKFLMENNLGRYLSAKETIDHRDCDYTNDKISNLRILGRSEHVKEDARRLVERDFICPYCQVEFSLDGLKLHRSNYNRDKGKVGPFCGKSCAGKYSREVQLGLREKEVITKPEREYTKQKFMPR